MHFHLPKPLHGWREFIGEVGIIVIGVLIALAAEQVIDEWRWERKVVAAEQTMNEEIKNSLLAVVELERLKKCSETQLDALQDAIIVGDRVKAKQILTRDAIGANRLWADNAFQATLAAQVSDHLGAEKLKSYSQIYQMIRDNRRIQENSEDASSDLAVLLYVPNLPPSLEGRYAELRDIATYRLRVAGMRSTGETLRYYAKKDLALEVTGRDYLAASGRRQIIQACEAEAAAVAR